MRTKIRVNDRYYKPVPWLKPTECDGCAFDKDGCINTAERNQPCDDGNEFGGMIFIPHNKQAIAEYVAKRLGVSDEVPLD